MSRSGGSGRFSVVTVERSKALEQWQGTVEDVEASWPTSGALANAGMQEIRAQFTLNRQARRFATFLAIAGPIAAMVCVDGLVLDWYMCVGLLELIMALVAGLVAIVIGLVVLGIIGSVLS